MDFVVSDTTPPSVTTVANALDANLECSDSDGITAALALEPSATDNCGTAIIHLVSDVPTPSTGADYVRVRTWNFTDGHGNTSDDFVQTITVSDSTAPSLVLNATTPASADGTCHALVPTVTYTLGDNCTASNDINVVQSPLAGTAVGLGTTSITVTATDANGNATSHSVDFVVSDTTPPSVTAGTIAAGYSTVEAAEAAAIAATTASDNCGTANLTASTVGTCYAIVTVTATDGAGNSNFVTYNTAIDNVAPTIGTITALQNASDVKNCANTVLQGTVNISVTASDNCSLIANPALTLVNGANNATASFVNESPSGTFNYSWNVTSSTANGTWTVTAAASDTVQTTTSSFTICVNKAEITGQVQLDSFVGASRDVVFVATTNWVVSGVTNSTVLQTWTNTLSFTSGVANFSLDGLAAGVNGLSAKTSWNLRRKLAVSFDSDSQAVVAFTGVSQLAGADLNGDNVVNLGDYLILGHNFFSTYAPADIDGNGQVDLDDYMILYNNYFTGGDPQ